MEKAIESEEVDFDTRIPAGTGIVVVGSSGKGEMGWNGKWGNGKWHKELKLCFMLLP